MPKSLQDRIQTLDIDLPVWERFFTVAPLVLIGTKEQAGGYDLAPKHMALPLGWGNYFGFVCTPRHRTYQNIQHDRIFTVSYPRPTQVLLASLAAVPRCDDEEEKSSLHVLPTFPARQVDGIFIEDAYVFLECELDRIVDGFGDNSLVAGRIVAAHAHEDILRTSDRDEQELIYTAPLFAYLYPGRTARISESYSFPFPVDFKR
jgi:flavin reductase (DIM6/NTAB) family NADH-FMN oxidoreductase RutF